MARGKYLSLEEARRLDKLSSFAKSTRQRARRTAVLERSQKLIEHHLGTMTHVEAVLKLPEVLVEMLGRHMNVGAANDSCLDHLMTVRYGDTIECAKCDHVGSFTKLKKLPAYACPKCGDHIHPMVGTPFERTRTPLRDLQNT